LPLKIVDRHLAQDRLIIVRAVPTDRGRLIGEQETDRFLVDVLIVTKKAIGPPIVSYRGSLRKRLRI
jgi:hypothetical protein